MAEHTHSNVLWPIEEPAASRPSDQIAVVQDALPNALCAAPVNKLWSTLIVPVAAVVSRTPRSSTVLLPLMTGEKNTLLVTVTSAAVLTWMPTNGWVLSEVL